MVRLIDADEAIKALKNNVTEMENYAYFSSNLGVPEDDIEEIINEVPTVDAAPVVHGEWEQCFEDWRKQIEGDKCSACGFEHYGAPINHYHYCPNCGTKMDGGDKA